MVIAHHLILTGYGHWLPNDPRGSLSPEIKAGKLFSLGDIHFGRKGIQPTRETIKAFHKKAQSKLEHKIVWFDETKRQAIADAFSEVIHSRRYTCFACAILSNHAHLVIRKHRDKAEVMHRELRRASATRLIELMRVPRNHPVWSGDPYKRFLNDADDVNRTTRYVRDNPEKSGLPPQSYDFVKAYTGEWSGHRIRHSGQT